MKRVKIVHAADIHFDTAFTGFNISEGNLFNEELREVFHRIINICKDNSVDILLLAGDIFDNNTIRKSTLNYIEEEFKLIKNTRVFITPGNHDPYGNKSFYKLINWPDNVYVFKGDLEKIYIDDLGVNVYGCGFNEKYCNTSMLKDINVDDNINIMLMHGEVNVNNSRYNPISLESIKKSKMDYIALGHIHNYSGIKQAGSTYYAYSGCPQGRGFDELGPKGIIYGEISKNIADLKFIKTSVRDYIELKIDISGLNTYEEIIRKITSGITKEDSLRNIYKIILTGEVNDTLEINDIILNEKLSNIFKYFKIKDKTSYVYDLETIEKGYSVKGIFVKNLNKCIEETDDEEEKEILLMALKYGVASLSSKEVNI